MTGPLHPYVLEIFARDRRAELVRAAHGGRLRRVARSAPPVPRRPTLRARVGWAFVEIGLRLAVPGSPAGTR